MIKILEKNRSCWSIENTDAAGVLIDAEDYYKAFFKACLEARRSIDIAGWQFDSDVELLRGADAKGITVPTIFLPFLNHLCEKNPALRIHLLAWDFSPIFTFNREWLQEWLFRWKGHANIKFHFDSRHAVGASHHQKLVVIDGWWAFVGGMDICNTRWDDRSHFSANPHRIDPNGSAYAPNHDVQAFVEGPAAMELARWFERQWRLSGAEPIESRSASSHATRPFTPTMPLATTRVALCETRGIVLASDQQPVQQIESVLVAAIHSAERLIYIEAQYLTSKAVFLALANRLEKKSALPLDIVIILSHQRKPIENLTLVPTEARMIEYLRLSSQVAGHSFHCYQVEAIEPAGSRDFVKIHSKLLIVDDRFLTLGSANLTNRSMAVDTEINLAWDAAMEEDADSTIKSIKGLRMNLWNEHNNGKRLILYQQPEKSGVALPLDLTNLPADPERPLIEEGFRRLAGRFGIALH